MKKLVILVALVPYLGIAQGNRLKYADKKYGDMAWHDAAEGYEDVLERGIDSSKVDNRLAECYDKSGNLEKALEWYHISEKNDHLHKEQLLRSALIHRQSGDYKGSIELLQKYEQRYGSTDVTRQLLSETENLSKLQKDNGNFDLYDPTINTPSSEMTVNFYTEERVFVSRNKRSKMPVMRLDAGSNDYFYRLYVGDMDEAGNISDLKKIKGKKSIFKHNTGPVCYDSINNYLYFAANTKNTSEESTKESLSYLNIYRARLDGRRLKDMRILPFNGENYSCAHPSLSADGKYLFFASDKPGGFGHSDLYRVEIREDGSTGEMENLGNKVNTSLDEFFPYMHPGENILFFASNGHPGLGGLDIFVAKMNQNLHPKKVENLGAPVNSQMDDFGFISDIAQKHGFLTSNREGGAGSDDFYYFTQDVPIRSGIQVYGNVTDIASGDNLDSVKLIIMDNQGNVIDEVRSDQTGQYEVLVPEGIDDIIISAAGNNYEESETDIHIPNDADEFNQDIALTPHIDYYLYGTIVEKGTTSPLEGVKTTLIDKRTGKQVLELTSDNKGEMKSEVLKSLHYGDSLNYSVRYNKEGYVIVTRELNYVLSVRDNININNTGTPIELIKIEEGSTDLNDVVEINPIYFDLNSFDIRPDAAIELDKVVKIMKENPGMVVELGSHTDSRGSASYNKSLSDKRAKSSAQYIISKGIDKSRITGKGYGESKLKISDAEIKKAGSEEEKEKLHQLNRRTEFIIVKMDYK